MANFRRKLMKRVWKFGNLSAMAKMTLVDPIKGVKFRMQLIKARASGKIREDRPQWRRWFQANRRYQRRLRALKHLTGRPIHPNSTGLLRFIVG